MTHNYEKTSLYWNEIYEKMDTYDPKTRLSEEVLESALTWMSEQGGTVLDFGCGTGHMLLRCLEKGASRTIGVDVSYHAISLSRRTAAEYYETLRTKWIWGDVKSLSQLPDACVTGVMLANILEGLIPEDGARLLAQIARLLDHNGRVVVKLNAYLNDAQVQKNGLIQLADEAGEPIDSIYANHQGLYCWNISEEDFINMISPDFELIKQEVLTVSNDLEQRIYYLELK